MPVADPDSLPGADEIGHPPRSLEQLILEPHLGTDDPQLDPALAVDGAAESFPLLGRETCRTRDAVHLLYETSKPLPQLATNEKRHEAAAGPTGRLRRSATCRGS